MSYLELGACCAPCARGASCASTLAGNPLTDVFTAEPVAPVALDKAAQARAAVARAGRARAAGKLSVGRTPWALIAAGGAAALVAFTLLRRRRR